MNENVDVYVTTPDIGINRELSGVFIQFEALDSMGVSTGKTHTVGMRTETAMELLAMLEQV